MLRWNPLALDIADAIVASRAASAAALARDPRRRGHAPRTRHRPRGRSARGRAARRVGWRRLPRGEPPHAQRCSRTSSGDHVDVESLARLARRPVRAGLAPLVALAPRAGADARSLRAPRRRAARRADAHALRSGALLRRTTSRCSSASPARLQWEQTHLFAAMDWAYRAADRSRILRVEALLDVTSRR